MSNPETKPLDAAKAALKDIFKTIPKIEARWDVQLHSDYARLHDLADFTVLVTANNNYSSTLAVAVAARGHPRQLREAITRLFRFNHHADRGAYLVVCAPFITPDGAAVCEEESVGYFDLAGNCRLQFANCYIERSGRPNPFRKDVKIAAPSLYGTKSERVLRVLLRERGVAWKVVPLAEAARVSVGTVSGVRNVLLEREWARDAADGILLTQAEALLKDWALVWTRRRERPAKFFTLLPLEQIERQMADHARSSGRAFALTGSAGAWRRQPMTRYQRTQAYWVGEIGELASAVGLKPAEAGANVHIFTPRDEGVFFDREEIDGVPVVSPLQLYLDLMRDPARGEEAATHLWDTVLFPSDGGPA